MSTEAISPKAISPEAICPEGISPDPATAPGQVSLEQVRRVAELASLQLTAEELPSMQHDLNNVLGYVAMLNEIDTFGVQPLAQIAELLHATPATAGQAVADDELRQDQARPGLDRRAVMSSAPETDGRFFKVPKVIER